MSVTLIPQLGAASTLTLDEALACLHHLHDSYAVIPNHATTATSDMLQQIRTTADDAGLHTVGQLLTASSSLVSKVAGVSNVTAFHNDANSAALHLARNGLAALATAAYVANGWAPSVAYHALPRLKMRTHFYRRPLEDDEILLCRLHALHLILTGSPSQRRNGAAFVVADAGLPPTEATALRTDDLVLDGSQALLMMAASRSFQDRILALQPFHAAALRAHVEHLGGNLIAYQPRKQTPGSNAAAASMHGVLGRLLDSVGIAADDLTAACVYTWGLRRILDHEGVAEALLAAGLAPDAAGTLLRLVGHADDRPTTPSTTPELESGF
ncbi:MAG: hypothetical protein HGA44_17240 [Cellulomonadaceae bacterium]|nr:hypothetical protein [Cellulomonadaceae bacterium]